MTNPTPTNQPKIVGIKLIKNYPFNHTFELNKVYKAEKTSMFLAITIGKDVIMCSRPEFTDEPTTYEVWPEFFELIYEDNNTGN